MISGCWRWRLGVLAPVVRLLINLPGRLKSAPPLAVAMALGGFVYVLALICFGVAGTLLADRGELASRDELFWGGGHVLQFVYAALMVTNWSILARMSLGEEAVDDRVFLASVALIALIAIAAPVFYAAFAPFSDHQREAFRLLQFGIAAPTLIFAVSLVRPRASLARPMAVARSGLLRPCDVARACSRSAASMGFLIDRLGHPHARALSRGHHRGQRLERRHAAHFRSQGTGQAACAAAPDPPAARPLRRRPVRRLDRHVRRRRLRRLAQNPGRRRIARRRRRGGHGGARDRFDLHHSGRRDFCHRRHPGVVAGEPGALDGLTQGVRSHSGRLYRRSSSGRKNGPTGTDNARSLALKPPEPFAFQSPTSPFALRHRTPSSPFR